MTTWFFFPLALLLFFSSFVYAEPNKQIALQEVDSNPRSWGTQPEDGSTHSVSPPSFIWFPQEGIVEWELEVSPVGKPVFYTATIPALSVHRPPLVFPTGNYVWRYRGVDNDGNATNWSSARNFTISADASTFALPAREDLLARIPDGHPRLYLTAETIEHWKNLVHGRLATEYSVIKGKARLGEHALKVQEPPLNLVGEQGRTQKWHRQHGINFNMTDRAASAAYTLAWVGILSDDESSLAKAVAIFDNLLQWDPEGSTSHGQHWDASYAYLVGMSRAYTLLYDRLSDAQRERAREILTKRGRALYESLLRYGPPWTPFGSHHTRSWTYLAEVAIVLQGDVPEADDWIWYGMNVFASVYPIWGGEDGGWHQGAFYQAGYMDALFHWALISQQIFGIKSFDVSPGLAKVGYFAMYSMPPNKDGAGWGDMADRHGANTSLNIKTLEGFARLSGNGYYADYVNRIREAMGAGAHASNQIHDLLLLDMPLPEAVDIRDLPPSVVFKKTGQVIFNTDLTNANESVQVQFKSSGFYGTLSHGADANNSFQVWAYGQNMLVKSGVRDWYGSPHHQKWTRSTRAHNNITVSGRGQMPLSRLAKGDIVASYLSPDLDMVVGEAGAAYLQDNDRESLLTRFTRSLIFIKPTTLVVIDYLQSHDPQTFEFWLHANEPFSLGRDGSFSLDVDGVKMVARFVEPQGLDISQTDQYDPNPDRIPLKQWHLQARTDEMTNYIRFVSVYHFYPKDENPLEPDLTFIQNNGQGCSVLKFVNADKDGAQLTFPLLNETSFVGESKIKVELIRAGELDPSIAVSLEN